MAGEMVQHLEVHVILAEVLSSFPSTRTLAIAPVSGVQMTCSDLIGHQACVWYKVIHKIRHS